MSCTFVPRDTTPRDYVRVYADGIINMFSFSLYPNPKYDYPLLRRKGRALRTELLRRCMHPRNALKLADWGLL